MLRLIIVFNIAHNNYPYLFHEYPVIGELILCTIYIHCHVIHKIVNLFENFSECKHCYIHYYSTLSSEVTQRSIHFPRVILFVCLLIYYALHIFPSLLSYQSLPLTNLPILLPSLYPQQRRGLSWISSCLYMSSCSRIRHIFS